MCRCAEILKCSTSFCTPVGQNPPGGAQNEIHGPIYSFPAPSFFHRGTLRRDHIPPFEREGGDNRARRSPRIWPSTSPSKPPTSGVESLEDDCVMARGDFAARAPSWARLCRG